MKVTQLNANHQSIEHDGKAYLNSYKTIVCEISNIENWNEPVIKITEGQPQSKTTAKYLNKFLSMHTSINDYKMIENV